MKLHELFTVKESVNYNGAFWLSQVKGSDSPVSPVGAVPKAQRINTKKAPIYVKKSNKTSRSSRA